MYGGTASGGHTCATSLRPQNGPIPAAHSASSVRQRDLRDRYGTVPPNTRKQMDVRCEKCQTEYELDESRLKPGGVTVKCTNCGHMFKIRKRANTNVGVPTAGSERSGRQDRPPAKPLVQTNPAPAAPPPPKPAPSAAAPAARDAAGMSFSEADRQWIVRLENGEQKTCRELATLQQWIVAGVVSRESLISRSGKT